MMITDIEKELAKEPQEDAFDRLMKIKNIARDKYLKKVKNAEMEYYSNFYMKFNKFMKGP